jgi:hypothetical protein
MTVHTPPPPVAGLPDGLSGPFTGEVPEAGSGAGRRVSDWVGLAAVWMAVDWLVGADVAGFLAVGIPLGVIFQLVVRRRPLRQLWARDTTIVARGCTGKVAVAAVLVVVVAAAVVTSAGSWIDDSWSVLLLAVTLLVSYALGRRLFVALSVAALVIVVATSVLAPRVATDRRRRRSSALPGHAVGVEGGDVIRSSRSRAARSATSSLGTTAATVAPSRVSGKGAGVVFSGSPRERGGRS